MSRKPPTQVVPGKSTPPTELQIGGQAVIEGVVMRGPDRWALAVRKPCGDIHIEVNPSTTLAQKLPRWNVFLVRGIFALIDSLVVGVKCLTISGGISLEDEEGGAEPRSSEADKDRYETPGEDDGPGNSPMAEVTGPGESAVEEEAGSPAEDGSRGSQELSTAAIAFSLVMALVLFLGIFIVLPTVAARYLQPYVPNTVLFNLVEGGIRIGIFMLYLAVVGLIPDIRRVFQYHGAEHKTVHAYEHGLDLSKGSVEGFSTAHLRCGTSFIVVVFIVSILVFSLFGKQPLLLRILSRVAIIPVIAAISYEIIKFAGRHENSAVVRGLMAPGLLFQKLTTREPDGDQIEVAIEALNAAVADDGYAVSVKT